jgi:succinyl-CoA synthetase beta subunit
MNKMKSLEFKKTEQLLSKYGIPLCPGRLVSERGEVLAFAKKTGYPLVLKVLSPSAVHKTDLGLVKTGISGKEELAGAWAELAAKKIKKEGILVQKQLSGVEMVIGMKRDSQFGPVLMFGLGGIFVELLEDVSFRIAPLKKKDAREMVKEIKGHKALLGFRSQKPVDLEKLTGILLSLSKLSLREKYIKEVDLNPVIVNEKGAWVADPRFLI